MTFATPTREERLHTDRSTTPSSRKKMTPKSLGVQAVTLSREVAGFRVSGVKFMSVEFEQDFIQGAPASAFAAAAFGNSTTEGMGNRLTCPEFCLPEHVLTLLCLGPDFVNALSEVGLSQKPRDCS